MNVPLVMAILLLIVSCKEPSQPISKIQVDNPPQKEQVILKVSVAKEGCYGPCPNEIYEIDSTLKVSYYGGLFADRKDSTRKGYRVGQATPGQWLAICKIIDSLQPMQFKNRYKGNEDLDGRELAVIYRDSENAIWGKTDALPRPLLQACDSIFKILNTVRTQKVNDTLSFETGRRIRN